REQQHDQRRSPHARHLTLGLEPSQIQISISNCRACRAGRILDRMTRHSDRRAGADPPRREEADKSTRRRLLEAAGQVFAEKGVGRATGKEICERAGTNPAAVNYYFGGIEGLYVAVVREARNRLVTAEAVSAAIAGKADPRAKLEAVLGLIAQA